MTYDGVCREAPGFEGSATATVWVTLDTATATATDTDTAMATATAVATDTTAKWRTEGGHKNRARDLVCSRWSKLCQ